MHKPMRKDEPVPNYPARMHAQGYSNLFVCLSVVVVTTKIARSRNLGVRATYRCNQSVEIGENWFEYAF